MVVAGAMGAPPAAFHAQTVISDPVVRVSYVLDPNTHTAQKISMPPVPIQDPAMAAAVSKAKQEMMATGKGSVSINEAGKTVIIGMNRNTAEASSPGSSTESLGTDIVEGIECAGTRMTLTIPAGQIGNEQPIVITNERWYSPKLQTVVLSKRHDPLSGDTTFKLTNIDQSEPSASLFQIPADYTVVDVGAEINAKIKANEANRK